MTIHNVSTILSVHPETVRRWVRSGELKSSIDSRKKGYTIRYEDLIIFIEDKPKYKKRFDDYMNHKKTYIVKVVKVACDKMYEHLMYKRTLKQFKKAWEES